MPSKVMTRVVLPSLFGFRMCPDCPHCSQGADPCMDSFGSNATPMGGCAGRCDAMVGAVESQKADGVLHIHLFLYLQMIMQFSTLHELARVLRDGMLSAQAMNHFMSYVRCASHPDVEAHRAGRGKVEKAWPAYADDGTRSRFPPHPPTFLGGHRLHREMSGCVSIYPDCSTASRG